MDGGESLLNVVASGVGSAVVAAVVIYALLAALRCLPTEQASAWRPRYMLALALGGAVGALAGAMVTFLGMAVMGGLPAPWNLLAIPLGGLAGGLVLGAIAILPVALVHGLSRLRRDPAGAETDQN